MSSFVYRLSVLVQKDRLPETSEDGMKLCFGSRRLTLVVKHAESRRLDSLILKETGFVDENAARAAGENARSALILAGLASIVPMDMGRDERKGLGFSHVLLDRWREYGVEVRPDVLGIDVFEESVTVSYMGVHAEGFSSVNLGDFAETLGEFLQKAAVAKSVEALELACELHMSGAFDATNRARFITYITVLEILAERRQRPQEELGVITEAISNLNGRNDIAKASKDSLLGGLTELRKESISSSLRSVVEPLEVPHADLGDRSLDQFITDCYNARSKIVHGGKQPADFDVRVEAARLERVTRELILQLMGRS
jgi:hypothetical protein